MWTLISAPFVAPQTKLAEDESGRGTTLAMLCCTIALFCYIKFGRAYVLIYLAPVFDIVTSATLILISLFTLGCTLHMMLIGEVSNKAFNDLLEKNSDSLIELANLVQSELELRERNICMHNGSLGGLAIRSLSALKRISFALNTKVETLRGLLAVGNSRSLTAAFELLEASLETESDCYTQLILGDPIAPIEQRELKDTIRALFRDVDSSFEHFAPEVSLSTEENEDEEALPSLAMKAAEERAARRTTVH